MRNRSYKTSGIILARHNYSEADRILTIYTKSRGKVTAMAKGVRKLKSRKRGSLEIFSTINFSAVLTKGMDIITEVEGIDVFEKMRKSLKKVSLAYFMVESVAKLTSAEEENADLYNLLFAYLTKVEKQKKLKVLRKEFVFDLLTLLGYWPEDKAMDNFDEILLGATEKSLHSAKIGKRVLT